MAWIFSLPRPNNQAPHSFRQTFRAATAAGLGGMTPCSASITCAAPPGEGMFTGVAVELDASNQIFTTLPEVPVQR